MLLYEYIQSTININMENNNSKTKKYLTYLYGTCFYAYIGANITNLWYITDDYVELELTYKQKNTYFGFIFGQIFMAFFLAHFRKHIFTIFLTILNIAYGPVMMFYFDNKLKSTSNSFFNVMTYVYVVWWFVYTSVYFLIFLTHSTLYCLYKYKNKYSTEENILLKYGSNV